MAVRFYAAAEESDIEELADIAEMLLDEEDARKDLKERRGIRKLALYDSSHKLKHVIPKGKHL